VGSGGAQDDVRGPGCRVAEGGAGGGVTVDGGLLGRWAAQRYLAVPVFFSGSVSVGGRVARFLVLPVPRRSVRSPARGFMGMPGRVSLAVLGFCELWRGGRIQS